MSDYNSSLANKKSHLRNEHDDDDEPPSSPLDVIFDLHLALADCDVRVVPLPRVPEVLIFWPHDQPQLVRVALSEFAHGEPS